MCGTIWGDMGFVSKISSTMIDGNFNSENGGAPLDLGASLIQPQISQGRNPVEPYQQKEGSLTTAKTNKYGDGINFR